jgi:hypothetical protein
MEDVPASSLRAPPDPERKELSLSPRESVRGVKIAAVMVANLLGTAVVFAVFLPVAWVAVPLLLLGTFALAYRWDLTRDRTFLLLYVTLGLGVAIVSLVTGVYNGLTDEAFAMPVFAQLWPNLYGAPITFAYDQYGTHYVVANVYYVYLPGLAYAQLPFLNYKWTALAAWIGSVYLLRRRGDAVVLWGSVWVGLMAANGFNDFIPFLTLTLTYVTLSGTGSKIAEVVSLGLKQFANVIVVAVHLYHRRWKDAFLAIAITAAILVPFAFLAPSGVVCHAVLFEPNACGVDTGGAFGPAILGHINYILWPLWVLAVFGPEYVRNLRQSRATGVRGGAAALARGWARPTPTPSPTRT